MAFLAPTLGNLFFNAASFLGAGFGAATTAGAIGTSLTSVVGTLLATTALSALTPQQTIKTEGSRLSDAKVTSAAEGEPVGLLFNTFRVGGNIIWATRLKEIVKTKKSGGGKFSPSVESTSYTYTASFALALCRGEVDSLDKVFFDGVEIDLDTTNTNYVFYNGTSDQEPDPTIEVSEGVGNVPAYKNLCYIVFTDLDLSNYGNRIPSISCEITRGGSYTLAEIITEVALEAGLTLSDIDTTGVSDISVGGYFRSDSDSYRGIIDTLLRVYKCEAVDTGETITFRKKVDAPDYTVPLDDLVASEENPFGLNKTRRQREDILNQVSYSYADAEKAYSVGTVITEKLEDKGTKSESANSLALTEVQARNAASIDLLEDRNASETVEFALPLSYGHIGLGSCVTIGGETYTVSGVEESTNLVFAGTTLTKDVYSDFTFTAGSTVAIQDTTPTATTLYNLDLPILTGFTEEDYQHLAGAYQSPWFGSVDVYTPDGSGGYVAATSIPFPAIMGVTTSDLPRGVVGFYDKKNTLTVDLLNPTDNLADVSELSLLNGANAVAILTPSGEWEVLQFQNATLNGDGTYTLDTLLRGQFGTEFYMGEPTPSGSAFVFLDVERLQKLPTLLGDIGREVTFRYGPFGFDVTDDNLFTDLTYIPKSTAFRTYAPVHLKESYDSGDINLSWVRRDRLNADSWEQTEIPMSESTEAYEVDIYNGGSVVRTLTSSTPSVTYTSAQQVTDFGSTQSSLTWRVYQMSASYGRGTPAIG